MVFLGLADVLGSHRLLVRKVAFLGLLLVLGEFVLKAPPFFFVV